MNAIYRAAVIAAKEKDDAISGGFDIVRKLFYKQHGEQKKGKEEIDGGFDIVKDLFYKQHKEQKK